MLAGDHRDDVGARPGHDHVTVAAPGVVAVSPNQPASLDAAQLSCYHNEFTDLVQHAAASLPRTPFTAADAPAPHGLHAWAQRVAGHTDLIAAS
jgi:hypothetical protein